MRKASREQALRAFKRRFTDWLPTDYEAYLLAGSPWDDRLHEVKVLDSAFNKNFKFYKGAVGVDYPYVLVESPEPSACSLADMNEILLSRTNGDGMLPKHSIGICGTQTSENIVLFVSGPRKGQVWLKAWHRLTHENIDDPEDDLHKLAPSFASFMKTIGQSW
jgi:hypothetical protein